MQVPTQTVVTARRLRREMTPPEARLWAALRGRQVAGLKFRRQHPIDPYVLDFFSAPARLAVEVDGAAHDRAAQMEHDVKRDAWLAEQGIEVVRVVAREVRDNLFGVLAMIVAKAGRGRS